MRLLVSAAVLAAVWWSRGGGSEPEAAPDPTVSHTAEPPTVATRTAPPTAPRQNTYTCTPYSGIDRANPVANLYRDTYTWGTTPPTKDRRRQGEHQLAGEPGQQPELVHVAALTFVGWGKESTPEPRATSERFNGSARSLTTGSTTTRTRGKSDVGAYESTMHRAKRADLPAPSVLSGCTWLDCR